MSPINSGGDRPVRVAGGTQAKPNEREVDAIGRVAVRLASDFSDCVVGATPFVEGGMALYPGFETGG
jgi:hypothetical protein